MKRREEAERQERLNMARNKKKQAQIKHIEKKITLGMAKIPEKKRQEIEKEEKERREQDLFNAKKDLWSLKGREKKLGEPKMNTDFLKIQELTKKSEKIVEILQIERKRIADEKKKEQDRKEQIRKEIESKQARLEKIEKLKQKWAMNRWVTNYIDENKER